MPIGSLRIRPKAGVGRRDRAPGVHHCQQGRVQGVALLMRPIWDLAACRTGLFDLSLYRGQTRLRFRPWWSEERKAQPIHNFVWHVWAQGEGDPVVKYWSPSSAGRGGGLTSEPRCRGQPGGVSGRGRRGRYHPAPQGPRRSKADPGTVAGLLLQPELLVPSPNSWSHVLPILHGRPRPSWRPPVPRRHAPSRSCQQRVPPSARARDGEQPAPLLLSRCSRLLRSSCLRCCLSRSLCRQAGRAGCGTPRRPCAGAAARTPRRRASRAWREGRDCRRPWPAILAGPRLDFCCRPVRLPSAERCCLSAGERVALPLFGRAMSASSS